MAAVANAAGNVAMDATGPFRVWGCVPVPTTIHVCKPQTLLTFVKLEVDSIIRAVEPVPLHQDGRACVVSRPDCAVDRVIKRPKLTRHQSNVVQQPVFVFAQRSARNRLRRRRWPSRQRWWRCSLALVHMHVQANAVVIYPFGQWPLILPVKENGVVLDQHVPEGRANHQLAWRAVHQDA